jgi:hypothetical protein
MGHFVYDKHVERVICIILVFSLNHGDDKWSLADTHTRWEGGGRKECLECGMDGSLIRDSECVYVETGAI